MTLEQMQKIVNIPHSTIVLEKQVKLEIGKTYKWKHEPQILKYIGKQGAWHQFTLNGSVWCEVLDSDLHLMEEV